jgi:hypothetical protein
MTESGYSLQQVVVSFGKLLSQLAKPHSSHHYQVVFHVCELKNINYLVLRYLNSGAPPFKEWAEEWLRYRKVWF